MILLFRRPYDLPAHWRLKPPHLRALRAEFEQSPYARYWLEWAQAGQVFVTVLALAGLIVASVLGSVVGIAMAILVLILWGWFVRLFAWGVAIRLSSHFADFITATGHEEQPATDPPLQRVIKSTARPRERARAWCAMRGLKQSKVVDSSDERSTK